MTLEEMLASLDKQFIARYGQKINDLNRNLYVVPETEGTFDVPVPTLGGGGGTVTTGKPEAFKLERPAVVKVEHKRMEALTSVYRIAVPRYECEIAAEKPEYFNYLFDIVVNKAINNYNHTFGGDNKVRFGQVYCSYERPGNSKSIFYDLDGGDFLEFRFFGYWASDKETTKLDISEVTHE